MIIKVRREELTCLRAGVIFNRNWGCSLTRTGFLPKRENNESPLIIKALQTILPEIYK